MTSKMISVKEKIYKQLEQLKYPDESFSDLLERLIQNLKKDPLKHFETKRSVNSKVVYTTKYH